MAIPDSNTTSGFGTIAAGSAATYLSACGWSSENREPNRKKQMFRSNNKMLAGVCAGIAEYFDIDPSLVRLGYALLSIASFGMGLVVYIILMILLPQAPVTSDTTSIERKS